MNLKRLCWRPTSGLRAVAHGFSRGETGLFNSSKPASAGGRDPGAQRALVCRPLKRARKNWEPAFPRLKPWATVLAPAPTILQGQSRWYPFVLRPSPFALFLLTLLFALPLLAEPFQHPSLKASVTVTRDARGIPYIKAANEHDLFFTQ